MGVHARTMTHVWRSEGNFLASVLSFAHVGSGEGVDNPILYPAVSQTPLPLLPSFVTVDSLLSRHAALPTEAAPSVLCSEGQVQAPEDRCTPSAVLQHEGSGLMVRGDTTWPSWAISATEALGNPSIFTPCKFSTTAKASEYRQPSAKPLEPHVSQSSDVGITDRLHYLCIWRR